MNNKTEMIPAAFMLTADGHVHEFYSKAGLMPDELEELLGGETTGVMSDDGDVEIIVRADQDKQPENVAATQLAYYWRCVPLGTALRGDAIFGFEDALGTLSFRTFTSNLPKL